MALFLHDELIKDKEPNVTHLLGILFYLFYTCTYMMGSISIKVQGNEQQGHKKLRGIEEFHL